MKRLILAAALAVAGGCAHSTSQAPAQATTAGGGPGGQYSFQSGEGAYTVQVTPSELSGPNYQVSRYPGGFRGTIDGRPLDIQWSDNGVSGSLAGQPVDLHLEAAGNGTRVQGSWGGRLSNIVVDQNGINGRMGRCDYSLGRAGDMLSGQSTCGQTAPSNTVVQLPQGLTVPLSGQGAAVLAMLLGQ